MTKRTGLLEAMQPTVFFASAVFIISFVLFGGLFTEQARQVFASVQSFIAETFGWLYILSVNLFLIFIVWLAFSRFSHIRLGGPDARPEFSRFTWFTMLFSAGMGIGLVFWGVAEPMTHYLTPPPTADVTDTPSVRVAMRYAFFHWGLHPWAIYIVFGLPVAYYHFTRGLPLAPRTLLYPLIGERYRGPLGHAFDVMCVVGTLFGVATSLGLGAMQINTGLNQLTGITQSVDVQILLIMSITLVATISVVTGIKRGIKFLSQFNIILALVMLLFVLVAGPTLYLIELLLTATGDYLQHLVGTSLFIDLTGASDWQAGWTLFYWGWWISWSPFVGIFIGRISKGRTIREFILNVFLVPTLVTFLWMSIFGGAGLYIEIFGNGGMAEAIQSNVALSLHALLDHLPLTPLTSVMGTLLIVVFFVTSSDSGSLVIDMITSGGHPSPPVRQRIFWAVTEGVVAAILLLAGGLRALQTASITSGLPIAVCLLLACYGLVKALSADREKARERQRQHDAERVRQP